MSNSVKVGTDDFVRVPRLEVGGANWVIFKDRLLWAADAKGVLGHLDRTSKEPEAPAPSRAEPSGTAAASASTTATPPAPAAGEGAAAAPPAPAAGGGTAAAATAGDGSAGGAAGQTGQATAETPDPAQTKYDTDIVEWRKREATAKQLVASTIPDSLFMKVRGRATAWAIWEAIAAEFEKKSRMFTVNLWRRLQDLRCGEKDDVRTHFAKMRTIHEDLAAMGQPPSEDDFYAIILGSMPPSYEPYLSALSAAMRATDKLLSPDDLMDGLTEEYERQLLRSRGGQSRDATDVALTANDRGGKSKSKRNAECFNCKKKGHYKADCWAPGGGKEGQGPKGKGKQKESASSADAKGSKDKAWLVYASAAGGSDLDDDMPDLATVSDSDSGLVGRRKE